MGVRASAKPCSRTVASSSTQHLATLMVELPADRIPALGVLIAGEGRLDGLRDLIQERVHLVAQPDAACGRETQRQWPVRVGEVVHVTPVGRHGAGGGLRSR